MTQLLDVDRLRQINVNPFREEAPRQVPVLCWTLDEQTKRAVAQWRLVDQQLPTARTSEIAG